MMRPGRPLTPPGRRPAQPGGGRSKSRPTVQEIEEAQQLRQEEAASASRSGYKCFEVDSKEPTSLNALTLVGPGWITVPPTGELVVLAPHKALLSLRISVDNDAGPSGGGGGGGYGMGPVTGMGPGGGYPDNQQPQAAQPIASPNSQPWNWMGQRNNTITLFIPEHESPHIWIIDAPGFTAQAKDVICGVDLHAAKHFSSLVFYRQDGSQEVFTRALKDSPVNEFRSRLYDESQRRKVAALRQKSSAVENQIRRIVDEEMRRSQELAQRIKEIDHALREMTQHTEQMVHKDLKVVDRDMHTLHKELDSDLNSLVEPRPMDGDPVPRPYGQTNDRRAAPEAGLLSVADGPSWQALAVARDATNNTQALTQILEQQEQALQRQKSLLEKIMNNETVVGEEKAANLTQSVAATAPPGLGGSGLSASSGLGGGSSNHAMSDAGEWTVPDKAAFTPTMERQSSGPSTKEVDRRALRLPGSLGGPGKPTAAERTPDRELKRSQAHFSMSASRLTSSNLTHSD